MSFVNDPASATSLTKTYGIAHENLQLPTLVPSLLRGLKLSTVFSAVCLSLTETFTAVWTYYIEACMYMVAAVVMVTAAYYAVVELR